MKVAIKLKEKNDFLNQALHFSDWVTKHAEQ